MQRINCEYVVMGQMTRSLVCKGIAYIANHAAVLVSQAYILTLVGDSCTSPLN